MVFYLSTETTCIGKIWFLSYNPKTSRPIRIQDSLNFGISETSWGMKLNFCMWLDIHQNNKFSQFFQVDMIRFDWACLKLSEIMSQLHLKSSWIEVVFLHVVRDPWKRQIYSMISSCCRQSCSKWFTKTSWLYLKNKCRYYRDFLHVVRHT